VIDEISFVVAKMFNVIDNRLRSIKHIQNNFFGGVDAIMIGDFFQAPHV
jgi:predicted TIM-barrel enzyme